MIRRDRALALIGGGVVLAVASASLVVLLAHGAEAAPQRAEAARDEVPGDIAWVLYDVCARQSPSLIMASIAVEDGRMTVRPFDEDGTMSEEPDALAAAEIVNECLDDYQVLEDTGFYAGALWTNDVATRLLLYDYGRRWMAPCLRGHGLPVDEPVLDAFLDPSDAPWGAYYFQARVPAMEDVLEARHACGSGSDLLARDMPG
ncbi:hypothetical protein [Protaetiibacter larvae]|uniref:Uncharacterized protein n=1 Tax=Protaetiibacter larvae TaxID=2592654 RepID=A0A5C1Y7C6_9MICO|nr:hypothetical protein [Protaetiibacter larvae]QEO09844.1 hypothetical protein FLP23_07380 [Protaetiibacter larvae]